MAVGVGCGTVPAFLGYRPQHQPASAGRGMGAMGEGGGADCNGEQLGPHPKVSVTSPSAPLFCVPASGRKAQLADFR